MGTIQNAINSTLGEAAKVGTMASAAGAIKAGETAKGLQEKLDIETSVAEENAALKEVKSESRAANAEVKKYKGYIADVEQRKDNL